MRPSESLRNTIADQARFVGLGVIATTGLLPLGLVTSTGVVQVIGVVYGVVWLMVCAPSTVAYVVLVADIWRLYRWQRPQHIAKAFIETAIRIDQPTLAREHKIHWFVDLSYRLNPSTTLVLALFGQAMEWRAEMIKELWQEARQSIVPKKAKTQVLVRATNSAEFGAELVEPLVRRHRWEGHLAQMSVG